MRNWSGKMTCDKFMAEVEVIIDDGGLQKSWYGSGVSDKFVEPHLYNTNIGEIIITNITFDNSSRVVFTFKGSGKPKI